MVFISGVSISSATGAAAPGPIKKERNKNKKNYSRKRQSVGSNLFRPKPATLTLIPHSR